MWKTWKLKGNKEIYWYISIYVYLYSWWQPVVARSESMKIAQILQRCFHSRLSTDKAQVYPNHLVWNYPELVSPLSVQTIFSWCDCVSWQPSWPYSILLKAVVPKTLHAWRILKPLLVIKLHPLSRRELCIRRIWHDRHLSQLCQTNNSVTFGLRSFAENILQNINGSLRIDSRPQTSLSVMQGDEVKDMLVSRPKHRHQDQESNGVALLHFNDALNCSGSGSGLSLLISVTSSKGDGKYRISAEGPYTKTIPSSRWPT